jgi:hypothetical protein
MEFASQGDCVLVPIFVDSYILKVRLSQRLLHPIFVRVVLIVVLVSRCALARASQTDQQDWNEGDCPKKS